MVKLGNFLYHYRNLLFPIIYALLFVPSPQIFESPFVAFIVGLIIALAGQTVRGATIGLEYIIRGGKNRKVYAEKLVTGGIFSHCRNPLYVGNVLIIFGLGFIANSLLFVGIICPLFVFFWQAIIRAEENFLYNKFGAEYLEYMETVNRWIPNFSGLGHTLSTMQFNWKRLVLKEHNSAFYWMAASIILLMKNIYMQANYALDDAKPYLITAFVALALTYALIRYLKKSGKMVSD